MTPQSDLVLSIPSSAAAAKTAAAAHTATLVDIQRHSASTVGFTLDVDKREALNFLPGQYVNITVPGTEQTRSYSFSSGPNQRQISFLVRLTEGGVMSGYLAEHAEVGDRLDFTGPMGSFYLRELARPALFLAGGTGLAPLLSMLESMAGSLTALAPRPPVHLLYGVTTDQDVVHLDTLEDHAVTIPGFTFDHCVADPSSSARHKGFVTGLIDATTLNDGDVDVYLCGPPPMVEAVRGHIATLGITPASFHYEKFTPNATFAAAANAALAGAVQ